MGGNNFATINIIIATLTITVTLSSTEVFNVGNSASTCNSFPDFPPGVTSGIGYYGYKNYLSVCQPSTGNCYSYQQGRWICKGKSCSYNVGEIDPRNLVFSLVENTSFNTASLHGTPELNTYYCRWCDWCGFTIDKYFFSNVFFQLEHSGDMIFFNLCYALKNHGICMQINTYLKLSKYAHKK